MALIPLFNLDVLNDAPIENNSRYYLGLSGIGEKCYRKLQHDHYWTYEEKITARIKRLFDFGHMMERTMINDLEKIGYVIEDDQAEIIATAGHWRGHIDGTASMDGVKFLLEMKTHNDDSFKELKKNKVKASKPGHYAQMQAYMGYKKLYKGLYLAYNKNNSEYYMEIIDFDPEYFSELQRKELEVLISPVLFPRIGTNTITWYECKRCSASKVCFGRKEVRKTCRSCVNVNVTDGGKWVCSLTDSSLTVKQQVTACESYELNPMFL